MKISMKKRVMAVFLSILIVVGMIPTELFLTTSVLAADEGSESNVTKKYVLEANNLDVFGVESYADGSVEKAGTENFFDLIFSSKSRVDEVTQKTFGDGYTATKRINFGGQVSAEMNSIKFRTDAKATVKVWWGAGADGRQIGIMDNSGSVAVTSNDESLKNSLYFYECNLEEAGTYYLGGFGGNNYIYKVEVITAIPENIKPEDVNYIDSVTLGNEYTIDVAYKLGFSNVTIDEYDKFELLIYKDGRELRKVTLKGSYSSDFDSSSVYYYKPNESGEYSFKIRESSEYVEGQVVYESEAKSISFTYPMDKPEITSVYNKGNGTISLDWTDVGADSYAVEYSVGSESQIKEVGKFLTCDIDGLTVGSEYDFSVKAIRGEEVKVSSAISFAVTQEAQTKWGNIVYGSSVRKENSFVSGSMISGNEIQLTSGGSLDENGILVNGNTSGKLAKDVDGLNFYYTVVPASMNFTFKAKMHVDKWYFNNGQEGMGIMAADQLGGSGLNNQYQVTVGKQEYYYDYENGKVTSDENKAKITHRLGVVSIEKKGLTADNISNYELYKNAYKYSSYPLECRYPYSYMDNLIGNSDLYSDQNIVDMYFTIQKNNNGFLVKYESADGTYSTTKQYFGTDTLSQIDKDNIYLGFFTARLAQATFSDVSITLIDPADDAPAITARPGVYIKGDWTYEISDDLTSATIVGYTGNDKDIVVPGEFDDVPVTRLGCEFSKDITSIDLSATKLERIERYKLESCSNLECVKLPSTLKVIETMAFYYCRSLTDINFPNELIEIGDYAFYYNTKLENVNLPESLERIGSRAFYNTAIKNLVIPKNVKSIGSNIFSKKVSPSATTGLESLTVEDGNEYFSCVDGVVYDNTTNEILFINSDCTSMVFPEGTTRIDVNTIYGNTNIKKIVIPSTVTYIEPGFIRGCTALEEIVIDENNMNYKAVDGVIYSMDGTRLIAAANSLQNVVVPEGVKVIERGAFSSYSILVSSTSGSFRNESKLESITLPLSLEKIEGEAFAGCKKLTKIELPENITAIGDYAFYDCTGLEKVVIPDRVTKIDNYAFYNCTNLVEINFPDALTRIGNYAFYATGIKNADLSNTMVEVISTYSFYNTKLESVVLPETLKEIGSYAFLNTYIKTLVIPKNVRTIGKNVFSKKASPKSLIGLDSLAVEDGNEYFSCVDGVVYDNTTNEILFINSDCTSMVFPEGTTRIDTNTIYGNANIKKLIIPSTVTYIEPGFIRGCSSLEEIIIDENNENYKAVDGVIYSKDGARLIAAANGLKNVVVPEGVKVIERGAFSSYSILVSSPSGYFKNESKLESITLPSSLEIIGSEVFAGCNKLTKIDIPENVTTIGDYAFYYCTGLESVIIPNSVKGIGSYAFYYCTSLSDVVLGNNLETIGTYAFYNCVGIKKINIPDSLTTIQGYAFYNTNITELDMSKTAVKNLRLYFVGSALTSIKLPEVLETIDSKAFANCRIETVTIPANVNRIDDGAFTSNYNFDFINVDENNKSFYVEDGILYRKSDNTIVAATKDIEALIIPEGSVIFPKVDLSNVKKLVIPSTMPSSEVISNLFIKCHELEEIIVADDNKELKVVDGILYKVKDDKTAIISVMNKEKFIIEDGTKIIDQYAFAGRTVTKEIVIPESVEVIRYKAFDSCLALESLKLPSGLKDMDFEAFHNCTSLKSINIPAGINEPKNISLMGYFNHCISLSEITIEEGNKYLEIDNGVLYVNNGINKDFAVFVLAGVKDVEFREGTTRIFGVSANQSIETVKLPNSLKDLTGIDLCQTFTATSNLKEIIINDDNPNYIVRDGMLLSKDGSTLIYCPTGKKDVEVPEGVTTIGVYALAAFVQSATMDVPASVVTTYGEKTSLHESVILPSTLQKIEARAFFNELNIKNLEIPEGVTDIEIVGEFDTITKNTELVVYEGSYAEQFAKDNGYKYSVKMKWEGVDAPVIANSLGKCTSISATVNMLIGEDGASKILVEVKDGNGNVIASKNDIEAGEEHNFTFEDLAVGEYSIIATASKDGEETVKTSETVKATVTGHTAAEDPRKENLVSPTAGEKGSYDDVTYCKDCDVELSRETHEIDMIVEDGYKEVSEELKEAGLADEAAVVEKLEEKAKEEFKEFDTVNSKLTDVRIFAIDEDNNKSEIDVKDVTATEMDVVIPYPEGTNGKDYKFIIVHMVDSSEGKYKAGDIEVLNAENKEDGMHIKVKSLSPMLINWKDISNITYGDLNGDGKINSTDAVLFKQILAGYNLTVENEETMDIDFNGKVNVSDTVRLMQFLAGYEVKLGNQY